MKLMLTARLCSQLYNRGVRRVCITCSSSSSSIACATALHNSDLSKLKTFPLQREKRVMGAPPCTLSMGCNACVPQREGEGGRFESADGALSHREKSCRVLRETISDGKNILRLWQRRRPCSQSGHGFVSSKAKIISLKTECRSDTGE